MSNVIQWKTGSKMRGSAEKVYEELEQIRKVDGDITPHAVVEKAKKSRSVMHKHFEWDDSLAGEKYRMEQARKLVRSIEIIHIKAPNIPAKAYSVVTKPSREPGPPRKVYQSTEEALQDPVHRDEILGNAIRDALSYRRKYASLQELSKVFTALDDFVANFGS